MLARVGSMVFLLGTPAYTVAMYWQISIPMLYPPHNKAKIPDVETSVSSVVSVFSSSKVQGASTKAAQCDEFPLKRSKRCSDLAALLQKERLRSY